ncbi:DMT family transporter [Alistipes sp. OttesenSCG-928-L06]|nr:DMT family transporter [Alistipes sp. OttesenSCG-928-L06]
MWITLAVASALLLGGYEVAKKLALNNNAVIPVLFLNIALSAAIFLPFSLLSAFTGCLDGTIVHVPAISPAAHAAILLKAVIVLSSWIFAYFAMKQLPIIITTSIKSTQPVFTLVGAILLFGEKLNTYQWIGILLAIIALMLFSVAGKKEGIAFERNKWVWFIFSATVLGAISSLWDKHLVVAFDKVAVQVYTSYYQLILMIPVVLLLWWPKRKTATPLQWRSAIIWVTVLLTLSDFLYFYSLSLDGALISVVSTIRKGGVVVPFIAGAILFREKNIAVKALLLGFVLIGMYLLYLGS